MKISLNGALIEQDAARIDPTDRGLLLGDGLFETIAVRNGAPRRLPAHLARLRLGAAVLNIPVPQTDERIGSLINEVLTANALADAVVRITLTRGPGGRGIVPSAEPTPTLMIVSAAQPAPAEPARVIIAQDTRRNEFSPLAQIKTLNYLDNIIARQEATAQNADDALLLNTAGRIAESTVANIFVLVNGGLVTPPVTEGALPGVMRAETIRLARAEELPVTIDMLAQASEVFLTNALGLRPVVKINDHTVGDGEPGLITQLLANRL
jgi:branched-chain amino acid aminotransferase